MKNHQKCWSFAVVQVLRAVRNCRSGSSKGNSDDDDWGKFICEGDVMCAFAFRDTYSPLMQSRPPGEARRSGTFTIQPIRALVHFLFRKVCAFKNLHMEDLFYQRFIHATHLMTLVHRRNYCWKFKILWIFISENLVFVFFGFLATSELQF